MKIKDFTEQNDKDLARDIKTHLKTLWANHPEFEAKGALKKKVEETLFWNDFQGSSHTKELFNLMVEIWQEGGNNIKKYNGFIR